MRALLLIGLVAATLACGRTEAQIPSPASGPSSPEVVVADPAGGRLFVADVTRKVVLAFDTKGRKATPLPIKGITPTGLAVAPDGSALFVTGTAEGGRIVRLDLAKLTTTTIESGTPHPTAPVVSLDGKTLWVCHRFSGEVGTYDATTLEVRKPLTTSWFREPIAAAVSPRDGSLVVGQHLPAGPGTKDHAATEVHVPQRASDGGWTTFLLTNGCTSLRGVCVSPDGTRGFATHILARYHVPTSQVERGWINTNALTVFGLVQTRERSSRVNTILLDDVNRGAANPWGVAVTSDGRTVVVAHSGTHELSLIDLPGLVAKLDVLGVWGGDGVSEDLSFLGDLRRRVPLKGKGPRGIAIADGAVWVAEYFSGSLGRVSLTDGSVTSIPLAPPVEETEVRRGERLFHDAALCYQNWQSCASCHPDARTDGLNWDLMNDGIGNPKSTKSMLYAHRTPPAMVTGIRPHAEAAVRAGIRHIQFAVRPEEEAKAIDAYLSSLKPVRGPAGDPEAIARGEKVFTKARCDKCHPAPLYTDLKKYDLRSALGVDEGKHFDTPTLVEIWRTAPYLHDGRAPSLWSVLKRHNPGDRHGKTSGLSEQEIDDLVTFLKSL